MVYFNQGIKDFLLYHERKGATYMKFTYAERNFNFSDDLKAYAEKKLSKLDKFFKEDAEASVTARSERGRYCLEVTVKSNSMLFRAAVRDPDFYHAIDSAEATIDRQIRKNKTRLEKRLRDGAFERSLAPSSEPIEEEAEFDIVRTKQFSIKPMTVEEAILQMNLLDHQFFVFKSVTSGNKFSVVYKRHDGGYGLIEDA